jgi:hypothetical protein
LPRTFDRKMEGTVLILVTATGQKLDAYDDDDHDD